MDFYVEIIKMSITVGCWAGLFSMLLFLRPIYLYAMARKLCPENEEAFTSSFLFRIVVAVFIAVLMFIEDDWKSEEFDGITKEVYAHPGGVFIDMLLAFLLPIFIAAIWPLLIVIAVIGAPVHALHVKNARKREFIEKLKGEHTE